ncbi:hypothetical protein ACIRRA_45565 [Nocardia sp. NPDC101769]|uniref:hypothetical protein n=1 Tax=Nocardia sp. NPDC101769 TaxID=3364333 RepID=UPI0037FEA30C
MDQAAIEIAVDAAAVLESRDLEDAAVSDRQDDVVDQVPPELLSRVPALDWCHSVDALAREQQLLTDNSALAARVRALTAVVVELTQEANTDKIVPFQRVRGSRLYTC